MSDLVEIIRNAAIGRRAELDRLAANDQAGAKVLFQAVFFNNIDQLWAELQMAFSSAVQAYNRAGRFMDLRASQSADEVVVTRDYAPHFHLTVSLRRDLRDIVVDVSSEVVDASSKQFPAIMGKRLDLGMAPSGDGVAFYHDGTIEDPFTTAVRVLRPYL